MKSGRWKLQNSKRAWMLWMLLPLLLQGCSLFQKTEAFTCTVGVAYKSDGTVDTDAYAVNRACLRGVQKRLDACYKE